MPDENEKPLLKLPFFRLGRWRHPKYGVIEGDQSLFDGLIRNFKQGVLGRLPFVRVGHDKGTAPMFGDSPALAWIDELVQEGDVLYALARPTSEDVVEDVLNKRYRFTSAEYDPDYTDKETGCSLGPVLSAVALTNEPFLTRLPDVEVMLSDAGDHFYLDYKEEPKMDEKIQSLIEKITESLREFFAGVKPKPEDQKMDDKKPDDAGQGGNGGTDPADVKLADHKQKMAQDDPEMLRRFAVLEEENRKIRLAQYQGTLENKAKELVDAGIPPAMVSKAKELLLAQPATTVKLSDDKEVAMEQVVFDILLALPEGNRISFQQAGKQEQHKSKAEAVKLAVDQDVLALGGRVDETGRYII